jgi:hypothetical protein
MVLYRLTPNYCRVELGIADVHCVEYEFRRLFCMGLENQWVRLEDFISGCTQGVGKSQMPQLVRRRGCWYYELAQYQEEEKEMIRAIIQDQMTLAGICQLSGELFKLTPFGCSIVEGVGDLRWSS